MNAERKGENYMKKNQSGITLMALVITVIVLTIIASISVYEGKQIIKNAKIQTFETNMLTIKAKAKAYGEEIDSQLWAYTYGTEDRTNKLNEIFPNYGLEAYTLSDSNIISQLDSQVSESSYEAYTIDALLAQNGLSELKEDTSEGQYIVIYNAEDYTKVDVAYTGGISYEGKVYYTLSALQEVYSEE